MLYLSLPGTHARPTMTATSKKSASNFWLTHVAAAAVTLILTSPAQAQRQVDSPDEQAIQNAIVVTANRAQERRSNVASSVEIVTEQQIDRTVSTSFLDILKKNSGVDVIEYPNGLAGIGLRGFRPEFSFTINPRTLVLVDGRPSGSTSFTTISPESIARIEVLKGPASALYGASAVGGVVNVITRRSSGPLQGQFTVGGGSSEALRSGATLGGTLAGPVDFDLDIGYIRQNDDFRAGNGEVRPESSFTRASGRARLGAALSPIVRIDGSFDFANLDSEAPGPLSFNPQSRLASKIGRVSGDVRAEISPADHTITLIGYASRENYLAFEAPPTSPRYRSTKTLTRYKGAQLQDNWQILDPLRLTYGFDWQKVDAEREAYTAAGARRAPSAPNESRETKALFAEAALSMFNERFILTTGGRYDWITVKTLATPFRSNFTPGTAEFGVFNPRGGAVVKLTGGLRLHWTVGRAFVPAQGIQLAGESEEFAGRQRRLTYGNPDLQPERNTTWDAGVGYANRWLNADLTYFDARTSNRITTRLVSETPTLRLTTYVNSERSRARGVEGQLALDAGAALGGKSGRITLNGSVTHIIEAVDLLPAGSEPIRNIADWKATGSVTVSNGSTLSGTVLLRHNGDRFDTDNSQGRIFTGGQGGLFVYDKVSTVDFSGRFRATSKDTLRLEMANVFDADYYEKADYPMPGRTIYFRYVRSF